MDYIKIKANPYHNSIQKTFLDYLLSLWAIIFLSPLFLVISFLSKTINKGPVFYMQERIGKNGRKFKIIKFRTMLVDAEKLQSKYKKLNEANGPVFKIRNDPRLTKFGKFLYNTGLDELPQLINVLKGEMSLVGPRPLPTYEAKKLTRSQKIRELVKPGITSSWVIKGSHNLSFKEWMRLDKEYVIKATLLTDISIILKTSIQIIKSILSIINHK